MKNFKDEAQEAMLNLPQRGDYLSDQEIKDLDYEERVSYLERFLEDNPEHYYINSGVKLKTGGRKAVKIGKDDFKTLLLDSAYKVSEKINYDHPGRLYAPSDKSLWVKSDIGYTLQDILNPRYEDIVKRSKFKKLYKDLSKIELSFENFGIEPWDDKDLDSAIRITSSGVPYIICYMSMDYGCPASCFIYWDGDDFRGFVPFKGNLVDTKKKTILNQDEEDSVRYILDQVLPGISKLYGPTEDYELTEDFEMIYDLIKANVDWMIEEFELRLTVV